MEARWTIGELADRVAAALTGAARDGHVQPVNGRVRGVPDIRAIRWYSTLGILDKPGAYRGRTALYGPRHVMQLVAVKRRQAAGVALAQIQAELAGASDARLAQLADMPAHSEVLAAEFEPEASATVTEVRDEARGSGSATGEGTALPSAEIRFWARSDDRSSMPTGVSPSIVSYGIEIGPGVTLHVASERPPNSADVEAVQQIAPQVLRVLGARGLHRTGIDR